MRITKKKAKELYEVLEEEREKIREENKEKRDGDEVKDVPSSTLWERERKKVVKRLQKLPDLVKEAASRLTVERGRGRKPKLDPEQKTMLFLFARINDKSNRDMESTLALLGPAFDVEISYKTIERLYSDQEVKLVLHNLFVLLLEKEGVSGNCSGDGTGYSLQTGKHYRSESKEDGSKENGKSYRYVFRLVDLETRDVRGLWLLRSVGETGLQEGSDLPETRGDSPRIGSPGQVLLKQEESSKDWEGGGEVRSPQEEPLNLWGRVVPCP